MFTNRRDFIKSTLMSAACLLASPSIRAEDVADVPDNSSRPNILFIFADDLGYEMLGCYGGIKDLTPNLDRMAANGVRFARAYSSPVCTPSRMSMYTGQYTPRHGQYAVIPVNRGTRMAVDFTKHQTYSQVFQKAGYQTSVTGKWQMATLVHHPDHCKSAGFDSWCLWQIYSDGGKTSRYWEPTLNRDGKILESAKSRYGPDVLTEYVIERMKTAKTAGQPFCIQHNMVLPHTPLERTPDDKPGETLKKGEKFHSMISYMDKQVGLLLDAVDELGLASNTIVVFAGDNGTQGFDGRRTKAGKVVGGKWDLTDGGIHVPLIARCPGRVPKGVVVDDLIDSVDLFPTFCELAQLPVPKGAAPDGISFCDPLLGRGKGKREWVTAGIGGNFIVFDGQWRMDNKERQLIDCRALPAEKPADMATADARAAKEKLGKILDDLAKLAPSK